MTKSGWWRQGTQSRCWINKSTSKVQNEKQQNRTVHQCWDGISYSWSQCWATWMDTDQVARHGFSIHHQQMALLVDKRRYELEWRSDRYMITYFLEVRRNGHRTLACNRSQASPHNLTSTCNAEEVSVRFRVAPEDNREVAEDAHLHDICLNSTFGWTVYIGYCQLESFSSLE